MNPQELEPDYPFADTLPEAGTALEIAPGVKWIRMALPFALNHINPWLLRDEFDDPTQARGKRQGWSVVDCCISQETSKAQWATAGPPPGPAGRSAAGLHGHPLQRRRHFARHVQTPARPAPDHFCDGRGDCPPALAVAERPVAALAGAGRDIPFQCGITAR